MLLTRSLPMPWIASRPSMFGGLSSRNHGRRCMISAALLVDPVAARRVALGAVLSTSAAKAAGWFALSVDSTTLSFAASALAPSRCWPAIRTSPLNAALVASRFVAAASARASTAALAPRACCASVLAASSCCAVAMSSARSPASCALSALSVSVALFAQRSAAAAARAAAASRNLTQRSQPEHCADLNGCVQASGWLPTPSSKRHQGKHVSEGGFSFQPLESSVRTSAAIAMLCADAMPTFHADPSTPTRPRLRRRWDRG
mmetsp:Transcript_5766/g.19131  ORF Transcript_5766/g.19131 Transcript_5766/m.19131 type:complete len:261 (-) Transcript_5766:4-786(-)